MKLVFCADPLEPRKPDPAYAAEVSAAESLGIEYSLVRYEALAYDRDPAAAVRGVPPQLDDRPTIYRGWMLRPEQYRRLYEALAERGIHLVNDPVAYRLCHRLPEWYPLAAGHTPHSVWTAIRGEVRIEAIMELLRPFGARPVVVKDFVKSRKHEWFEACFIPSATDREAVKRVVGRFMELQGEDIDGGLVFREFLELEPLGRHPRSGMPLTREYRVFFVDGEPIYTVEYWDEAAYAGGEPPIEQFRGVADVVRSRFFAMDLARRVDGAWTIIELGDGQVTGLPGRANVAELYRRIAQRVAS